MKRLMLTVLLVLVGALALTACATGNEESGTATASALQSTTDASSTQMGATAAVVQATTDAENAVATAAIADAQTTADTASTAAAGQPTDEAATVVPPTEEVATEAATAEEATVAATAEAATAEPEATEAAQAATEEPTAEPTVEEATVEPTAEATVEEATEVPAVAATEAPEEATAEPEATSDVASSEGATTVCLVTDLGRVNDGSFNQSAYEGMLRAEADLGLTTKYIETQAQTDYEANIGTCLDEGFDVIVTVGFLIYDATVEAAKANPDVYFIGVDQFPAESIPNFVGIQFREDQAGFLAGAMAALMTESDKVGGVYGVEIPPVVKFRNGFEQGVRHINPDIELFGVYIPDFIAPQLGAETAEAFMAEGVDVVFGAGGPTGSGGIVRAAELGAWVIGVDKDEYLSTFGEGETPGADRIITSAVERVDKACTTDRAVSRLAQVPGGLAVSDVRSDQRVASPCARCGCTGRRDREVHAIFESAAARWKPR